MNIALIDVDGHASKKKWGATIYPNLALAKLAAWHKQQGDLVEWYTPFAHYDRVYMAKVFNFTPDFGYIINNADEIIRGGTGYDVHSRLPEEVDRTQPDYSIYPEIPKDYAYGFLTRGCPNKCPWCVVPVKEGRIVPYMDVDEIAVDGRHNLVLMDNNILAAGDYAVEQLNKIIERGYRVDFNQALDARLVTDEFAQLLAKVKWLENNRIRFGCDTHKQIDDCEHAIELLEHYGFHGQFFLYTMIGGKNDLEECYSRINHWRQRMLQARKDKDRCYTYPHAQPYRDPLSPHHNIPQWQRDLAQHTNKKQLFVTCDFKDFSPRKGFTCKEYFTT